MKNRLSKGQATEKRQLSPRRKRVGSPLFRVSSSSCVERSLPLRKRNVNQLGKESNSICDDCILNSPKSTVEYVPLLRSKLDDIVAGPNHDSDIPFLPCTSLSRSYHSLQSKAMKFSSLRKCIGCSYRTWSRSARPKFQVLNLTSLHKRERVEIKREEPEVQENERQKGGKCFLNTHGRTPDE